MQARVSKLYNLLISLSLCGQVSAKGNKEKPPENNRWDGFALERRE